MLGRLLQILIITPVKLVNLQRQICTVMTVKFNIVNGTYNSFHYIIEITIAIGSSQDENERGLNIHLIVFCTTNFFRNGLSKELISKNIRETEQEY